MKLKFLALLVLLTISSLCAAQRDRNDLLESRSLRTSHDNRILKDGSWRFNWGLKCRDEELRDYFMICYEKCEKGLAYIPKLNQCRKKGR